MNRISSKWAVFGLFFALASCVSLTINVYFPAKEIQEAAEEIEERVRTGEGAEGLEQSRMTPAAPYRFAISLGGREAWAADDLDLDIKTPLIVKIIETRTERYKKELEPLLDSGVLGEGFDAYLALRDKTGLDLKAMAQMKKLIDAENKDRQMLYEEILRANKVETSKENMGKVENLFAKAIQVKMKPGQWYEVKINEKKTEWIQKKKEEKK
ncbi:MAG: DUF1318 domain-containing protein [Candidatus Omnitrophica bacterium]|nr:DUF1318 domain-containing protein [Candidatus Omnitrophota bacterium]